MIESKKVRNDNLYNASLSKFLTIVQNKMLTSGKIAIKVNPYNTRKQCSTIGCKNIYTNMDLSVRKWCCDHCNTIHHRDINSA
jgi:transposase